MIELNINEDLLDKEMSYLKEKVSMIQQKQKRLNELSYAINEKQLQLDEILYENKSFLNSKLQANILQIKSVSEALLESIGSFNSDQINKTRSDMTFQSNQTNCSMNSAQTNNSLVQAYAQFRSRFQLDNPQRVEHFSPQNKQLLERMFNFSEIKDQKCLFEEFMIVFKHIKRQILDLDKFARHKSRYNGMQELTVDLKNSIAHCHSNETNELNKYVGLLNQNLKTLRDSRKHLLQVFHL